MRAALQTRLARLEAQRPRPSLSDLPDEVFQRYLDLLLHVYVHEQVGMPTESFEADLAAMRLDSAVSDLEPRAIGEGDLHREVVSVLREECGRRESYKRLLVLLGEGCRAVDVTQELGPVSGHTQEERAPIRPTPKGASSFRAGSDPR